MYAVIFKSEINKLDSRYSEMASQMRELAINKYAYKEFVSVAENNQNKE